MEDVVLHYKPGPDQDLPALIEATERLLAPFPCRPPQVFSPWFPSIVDRHLPLRPARPPPRILSAPGLTTATETREASNQDHRGPTETLNQDHRGPTETPNQDHRGPTETPNQDQDQTGPEGSPERGCGRSDDSENDKASHHRLDEHEPNDQPSPARGVPCVPETPPDPAVREPGPQVQEPGPQVQEPAQTCSKPESKPESPSKRCWTVFMHQVQTKDQTQVQSRVQASSRRFQQTVSKLRLQSRQRVKWVIDKTNCRDIEQVWRCLSRPPRGLSLPSCCNAHIERSLAQVWVYCDLLQSEQVGLSLKQGLKLRGRISLWERRLGSIYSL